MHTGNSLGDAQYFDTTKYESSQPNENSFGIKQLAVNEKSPTQYSSGESQGAKIQQAASMQQNSHRKPRKRYAGKRGYKKVEVVSSMMGWQQ